MPIVQISRIQHRRGKATDLPQLAAGELGWVIDDQRLFIGNGTVADGAPAVGNTEIVTLLATDIDGDELTYTISNQPSHGSVTLNGNQATYIADGTYVGSDSFTFIAYDGVKQ